MAKSVWIHDLERGTKRLLAEDSAGSVWTLSGGEPSLLLGSRHNEENPSFSRDGRFIAYESDDVGRSNVFVQPFPGPGPRTQVSPDGGHLPRWGPNGRDLFYLHKDALMVITLEMGPPLQVGRPRVVLEQAYQATEEGPNVSTQFEVAPDGKRFLAVLPRRTAAPLELRLVLNWFEELERLAPHPGR